MKPSNHFNSLALLVALFVPACDQGKSPDRDDNSLKNRDAQIAERYGFDPGVSVVSCDPDTWLKCEGLFETCADENGELAGDCVDAVDACFYELATITCLVDETFPGDFPQDPCVDGAKLAECEAAAATCGEEDLTCMAAIGTCFDAAFAGCIDECIDLDKLGECDALAQTCGPEDEACWQGVFQCEQIALQGCPWTDLPPLDQACFDAFDACLSGDGEPVTCETELDACIGPIGDCWEHGVVDGVAIPELGGRATITMSQRAAALSRARSPR